MKLENLKGFNAMTQNEMKSILGGVVTTEASYTNGRHTDNKTYETTETKDKNGNTVITKRLIGIENFAVVNDSIAASDLRQLGATDTIRISR